MRMLLVILLLCFLSKAYSQKTENDYKRLIDSSISLKTKDIIQSSTNIDQRNVLLNNIYLIDENSLPYKYLSTIDSIEFKTIDVHSHKNRKVLRRGIKAWKISAALKNTILKIAIVYLTVSYEKGKYYYTRNNVTQVIFEYSCGEKKWIQVEFKNSRD